MINLSKKTTPELLEIVNIIEELRNTSSRNDKMAILKNNKENELLKTILEFTYNPFKKYKITEKSLGGGDTFIPTFESLDLLLHVLRTNNLDHQIRCSVNHFLVQTDEEIRDLYRCVILKDLKIGVNEKTLNKI